MVVVRGSGVDEWPCMKPVWVIKYILVLGCPSNFFLYETQGEGESKQILREYGFKAGPPLI